MYAYIPACFALVQSAVRCSVWSLYISIKEIKVTIPRKNNGRTKTVSTARLPFLNVSAFLLNKVQKDTFTGFIFHIFFIFFREQGETEQMVYVTESGSVYHRNPGCSYLNVSLKQIPGSAVKSAGNQYGEHYSACEICSRNQNPAGVVYVTERGNRYHNLESCSGLKRTVRLVKASSVQEMGACSRCG